MSCQFLFVFNLFATHVLRGKRVYALSNGRSVYRVHASEAENVHQVAKAQQTSVW